MLKKKKSWLLSIFNDIPNVPEKIERHILILILTFAESKTPKMNCFSNDKWFYELFSKVK